MRLVRPSIEKVWTLRRVVVAVGLTAWTVGGAEVRDVRQGSAGESRARGEAPVAGAQQKCAVVWSEVAPDGAAILSDRIVEPVRDQNQKIVGVNTLSLDRKRELSVRKIDPPLDYARVAKGGRILVGSRESDEVLINLRTGRELSIPISNQGGSRWTSQEGGAIVYGNSALVYQNETGRMLKLNNVDRVFISGDRIVTLSGKGEKQTLNIRTFDGKVEYRGSIPSDEELGLGGDDEIYGRSGPLLVRRGGEWRRPDKMPKFERSDLSRVDQASFIRRRCEKLNDDEEIFRNFEWACEEFKTEVIDAGTGEIRKVLDGAYRISSDGRFLTYLPNGQQHGQIYRAEALRRIVAGEKPDPLVQNVNEVEWSNRGNWAVLRDSRSRRVFAMNMNTGRQLEVGTLEDVPDKVRESVDGSRLFMSMDWQQAMVLDTNTGSKARFEFSRLDDMISDDLKSVYRRDQSGGPGNWVTNRRECVSLPLRVSQEPCDCLVHPGARDTSGNEISPQPITPQAEKKLCEEGLFSEKDWDPFTPALKSGTLSLEGARLYLRRFQRMGAFGLPSGYQREKHAEILASILNSPARQKLHDDILLALRSIHARNPGEAERWLRLYPEITKDARLPKTIPCLPEAERDMTAGLKFRAQSELRGDYRPATTDKYDWLALYRSDVQALSKSERKDLAESIGENLALGAGQSSEASGVMHSKLYYFAKKWGHQILGEPYKEATDMSYIVRDGMAQPVILGTKSLGESEKADKHFPSRENPFGFYSRALPAVVISDDTKVGEEKLVAHEWVHNGKAFRSEAQIRYLGDISNQVVRADRPNYDSWTNGMTGVVVQAARMGEKSAKEMQEFYESEGFTFQSKGKVPTKSFLAEKIKSGEVSYLFKDAHADGDDRNLFRPPKEADLSVGVRKNAKGQQEKIYLLKSAADERGRGTVISNQEFGQWVRAQPEGRQLLYINGSCTSYNKAGAELAAARSPKLQTIATGTEMDGFYNYETDPSVLLLSGLHRRKPYSEIRDDLKRNSYYASGSGNQWLFPDEERYEKKIRQKLERALDVEVTVKGPRGELVHPDELIDH